MVQLLIKVDHAFLLSGPGVVGEDALVFRPHDQDVLVELKCGDLLSEIVDRPDRVPARVVDAQFLAVVAFLRALIVICEHSIRFPACAIGHAGYFGVHGIDCVILEIRQIQCVVKIQHALTSIL